MKNRPRISQKIVDELLVESKHRCNVCGRNVAQVHHIDPRKGNNKSNLIVLCTDCHRRAHLPSYFERRITKKQLKMYKKRWIKFCKSPFFMSLHKQVLTYTFLNEPRIQMLFNQLAPDSDMNKVDYLTQHKNKIFIPTIPFERMMQTILNKMEFVDLTTLDNVQSLERLKLLEGFQVYIARDFYAHNLKTPMYYEKHGINDFPFLFKKQRTGNKTLLIKIAFDPTYIISTTGYVEMKGHHRLSCYGIVKRVRGNKSNMSMEIMPLAIGLQQPISPYVAHFRLL